MPKRSLSFPDKWYVSTAKDGDMVLECRNGEPVDAHTEDRVLMRSYELITKV